MLSSLLSHFITCCGSVRGLAVPFGSPLTLLSHRSCGLAEDSLGPTNASCGLGGTAARGDRRGPRCVRGRKGGLGTWSEQQVALVDGRLESQVKCLLRSESYGLQSDVTSQSGQPL